MANALMEEMEAWTRVYNNLERAISEVVAMRPEGREKITLWIEMLESLFHCCELILSTLEITTERVAEISNALGEGNTQRIRLLARVADLSKTLNEVSEILSAAKTLLDASPS